MKTLLLSIYSLCNICFGKIDNWCGGSDCSGCGSDDEDDKTGGGDYVEITGDGASDDSDYEYDDNDNSGWSQNYGGDEGIGEQRMLTVMMMMMMIA